MLTTREVKPFLSIWNPHTLDKICYFCIYVHDIQVYDGIYCIYLYIIVYTCLCKNNIVYISYAQNENGFCNYFPFQCICLKSCLSLFLYFPEPECCVSHVVSGFFEKTSNHVVGKNCSIHQNPRHNIWDTTSGCLSYICSRVLTKSHMDKPSMTCAPSNNL